MDQGRKRQLYIHMMMDVDFEIYVHFPHCQIILISSIHIPSC